MKVRPGATGTRTQGEKWASWGDFSGIRSLQTRNIALSKKGAREIRVIFPTRVRLFNESRFCLGTLTLSASEKTQGGPRAKAGRVASNNNNKQKQAYRGPLGSDPPDFGTSLCTLRFGASACSIG